MYGNNSAVEELRALTSIELFLHASYYSKHPNFFKALQNSKHLKSIESILKVSVSDESFNTGLCSERLVQAEAKRNTIDRKWGSFLCVLGLSSIINRNIISVYPDFGLQRYKDIFNIEVIPRSNPSKEQKV